MDIYCINGAGWLKRRERCLDILCHFYPDRFEANGTYIVFLRRIQIYRQNREDKVIDDNGFLTCAGHRR